MAKTLHKKHGYYAPGIDEPLLSKVEESQDSPERFIDEETERIGRCVHGHAIRNPQEFGGTCFCGRPLCKDCISIKCELDGHIICRDHAWNLSGMTICSRHGFWRTLFHLLGR